MPYLILAVAAASLLLLGCSFGGTLEERQERARRILDQTTEGVAEGVKGAKNLKNEISDTLSGATHAIRETADELKDRADKLQEGVEKVADAVEGAKEGADAVRGALNVSGEEEGISE